MGAHSFVGHPPWSVHGKSLCVPTSPKSGDMGHPESGGNSTVGHPPLECTREKVVRSHVSKIGRHGAPRVWWKLNSGPSALGVYTGKVCAFPRLQNRETWGTQRGGS